MDSYRLLILRCAGVITGCALLAACGGATPPPAELAVTASTLSDAERAGAVQYAPVELNRARDELARAQDAARNGESQEAQRVAEEAEADAKLALMKARAAQAGEAASTLRQDQNLLRSATAPATSLTPANSQ